MKKWYMMSLVGKDQSGIVAQVSAALFEAGGALGETSMMRLGCNFTIMMMVEMEGSADQLG
ncbi:MAG TPA: amino acid-binding ACT, partial [Gammaproteobacteria bacterium]|nr:amino acid-binding ACT [Gammaproteobacteria bacterium]